jgi:transposase
MSSEITSHERALIDAAIEAGKVTRVPPGQSALWSYQWDSERHRIVHTDTFLGIKHKPGHFLARSQHGRKPEPGIMARRQKVRALHDEGLSRPEISERLGIAYNTLVNDYDALGIRPNEKPRRTKQARERVERLKQLEALLDDGTVRSAKQLRGIMRIGEATFWDYMKALGRTLPREVTRVRSTPEKALARRADIQAAWVVGSEPTIGELCAHYGVHKGTIYGDLKALGLDPPGRRRS